MSAETIPSQLPCGLSDEEFLDLCEVFRAFKGRVIVLIDKAERMHGCLYLPQESDGQRRRSKRLEMGTVISSANRYFKEGDRVGVIPNAGLQVDAGDPSITISNKIPKGREVRFYRPRNKSYEFDGKDCLASVCLKLE